jgi:beta-lactamase regulating signal transducer with metallopeptidase domain
MTQAHAIEKLLGWLGWQSLYVTIAALVVLVLIRLCRVRDPRILLVLWGLVLLRFFLPLDLAMAWSARNQFHGAATAWVGSQNELRQQAQLGQRSAAEDVVTRIWLPSQTTTRQASRISGAEHFHWRSIAFGLWLIGIFTLGGLALRQHVKLLSLLRRSTLVEDADIVAQINLWRARLNIRRAVIVRSGDAAMSPFTFGLRSPVIYMPAALLVALSPDDRDAIFGHELAHVRGLDMLWLIAERAVQILFFFHPVAWFATDQLARARERTCDLRAVRSGDLLPGHYWSSVLVALRTAQQNTPAFSLAPSLGPSAQPLKERILAMQHAQPMTRLKRAVLVCGTVVLAFVLLPMARSERVAAVAPLQVAQLPAPPAPPAPISVPTTSDADIDINLTVAQARRDCDCEVAYANEPHEAEVIEGRQDLEQSRIDFEQAASEAEADAKRAMEDAEQAQREAYSRISEARLNAREIEIEALQDTLEGLRDAVQDLRNSHDHDLASAWRNAGSQRIVNTNQIIAGVIEELESSAQQIEKQLVQARAK